MKFADVIGQEEVKQNLIGVYEADRVSHAYLLYGAAGIGKLALAIAFAQFLSCENKQTNDSCGECPSCKKYEKLIHPDLHFVFPVVKNSKLKPISESYIQEWRDLLSETNYFSYNDWLQVIESENKQGIIYADEASEIIKKLNLKTFESKYKILILWLPEKMNTSCANKILKTLEEPSPNTVFILVSNDRENVLTTILSRTQPIKILGIDRKSLKQEIIQNYNLTEPEADDIVAITNGSLLKAIKQIKSSAENKFYLEQFSLLMRIAYSRKFGETIKFSDEISKETQENQKGFLRYCLGMLRENFVCNTNISDIIYMTNQENEFAKNFSKFVNSTNIEKMMNIFNDAHYHIERNANAKILFVDLIFNIMKLIRK